MPQIANLRRLAPTISTLTILVCATAASATTLSTLVDFNGTSAGSEPEDSLIIDANGNLYGTTQRGGANNFGTVFEITAHSHSVTTLASFNGTNGEAPYAGLVADSAGNFYGTTRAGGTSNDGVVFKIAAGTNVITPLASFNGTNGKTPFGGVIADSSGNLYGTTNVGGSSNDGVVFKVAAGTNVLSTVANFTGIAGIGANPAWRLDCRSRRQFFRNDASRRDI